MSNPLRGEVIRLYKNVSSIFFFLFSSVLFMLLSAALCHPLLDTTLHGSQVTKIKQKAQKEEMYDNPDDFPLLG